MYFCRHTSEEKPSKDSHSKRNVHEARMITEAAKTFCQQGVHPSRITVLCTYRGQASELRMLLISKTEVLFDPEIKLTSFAKFRWLTAVYSSVVLIDHYCYSESGDGEIFVLKCPIFVNHIMTVLVSKLKLSHHKNIITCKIHSYFYL